MQMDPVGKKTALLIRCTPEEATAIRKDAALEHRTISGYVLNAVMFRMKAREGLAQAGAPIPTRTKS